MASRAAIPLRTAARQLRVAARQPCRTVVSSSTPAKPTSTYTRRATTATTTNSSSSASSRASPYKPAPAASEPTTTTTTTTAPHVPVPQVSGEALPDTASMAPVTDPATGQPIDWASSFHGLGTATFGADVAARLQAPLDADDIEVKPDGILYLPEIKYRRVLNAAFGPGGWGLAPRGDLAVTERIVYRDYALVAHGRFIGQARGEMQYFNEDGISTAAEGCKSNALMRCCKDLGIASELWDPRFIRKFMKQYAQQIWVEHVTTKKKKQIWLRKDDEVRYPFKKTS